MRKVSGERVSGVGVFQAGKAVRSREFSEAVGKIFSSKLFQESPMILFRFNVSTSHPPLSPHSRPSCHNLYTVGNPQSTSYYCSSLLNR